MWFNDGNKTIICCTKEKYNESTFIVRGNPIVVIEGLGLDGGRSFIAKTIIDIRGRFTDLDDGGLCKELVSSSAALAMHTTTTLLVCEEAKSFGEVASVIASFYLLFRNLDVKTCIHRIQRAFREQCPSIFGQSYEMEELAENIHVLNRIQRRNQTPYLATRTCILSLKKFMKDYATRRSWQ